MCIGRQWTHRTVKYWTVKHWTYTHRQKTQLNLLGRRTNGLENQRTAVSINPITVNSSKVELSTTDTGTRYTGEVIKLIYGLFIATPRL